jgi:hypothetical protein
VFFRGILIQIIGARRGAITKHLISFLRILGILKASVERPAIIIGLRNRAFGTQIGVLWPMWTLISSILRVEHEVKYQSLLLPRI